MFGGKVRSGPWGMFRWTTFVSLADMDFTVRPILSLRASYTSNSAVELTGLALLLSAMQTGVRELDEMDERERLAAVPDKQRSFFVRAFHAAF